MPAVTQPDLYSPIRNRGVFSSHWLEHRLELEPEWKEQEEAAADALTKIKTLWATARNRVEKYGNEAGLEHGFIQPVIEALGWKLKYQAFLQGREPDYALFLSDTALDAALNVDHKSEGFWKPAAVVADAKKWDLPLDKKTGAAGKREYPPEQIEWYLDRSRKPFGILTNGRLWRLVPRELGPHQRRFQTYYEVDLAAILNDAIKTGGLAFHAAEDFRRFYLLFGPAGFIERDGRKSLVRRAVEGSSEYRVGVSEGLKEKAFEALRICIEGFLAFPPNDLTGHLALEACRENSFTLLCRLLFVMFAEDRQLLPYKLHPTYTENRSLGRFRDEIANRLDRAKGGRGDDFSRQETGLWDDLLKLFDLIDAGGGRYGVPAYNGGLFDPAGHPFLTEKKLSDWHLARVIDNLGRAADPEHPDGGLFRVDYRDLALQHLGGIYEGLLELRPTLATVRMVVYTRRNKGATEEIYVPATDPQPQGYSPTAIDYAPGSVYLVKDTRRRSDARTAVTPIVKPSTG